MLNRGYIKTRVYIKEQDLTSGILKLELAAGTIGEITFADKKTWGTWKNTFAVGPGDILNSRDIEQGLEQMKRVPSQEVDIKIRPAKISCQSDLVLTVKRRSFIDDTEITVQRQETTVLQLGVTHK